MTDAASPQQRHAPTFAELFTPKLVTVLREGYGLAEFRADVIAGLTVAVVALPLSMAIAIASGVTPERGLFTAVAGGFFVSLLSGSRFQIGGPAGAFIVIIASIVERHGYQGLVLATLMAGIGMIAAGFLRLGTYIKFIPFPVTVGFTAGIAAIIFASQVHDLFGLDLAKEPAALLPKLVALWGVLGTIKPVTVALSAVSIGLILAIRHFRPIWPGMLIAVAVAALLTWVLKLPVETIGTRFGGVPSTLPPPTLPVISFAAIQSALPDAASILLLGSIESLLSAVVADTMTGRRHRSNCELVAQGVGNIASALFGGIASTGLIARTATNIRAGGRTPIAGLLHSAFVLAFMLIAAPLASYIPLAALGAVLAVVAWNMAERHEFASLITTSRGDAAVLLATFLLTIFVDLTTAISVGVVLAAFLFLHNMAENVSVSGLSIDDQADATGQDRVRYDPAARDGDVMVCRIRGAFFFGATAEVGAALDRIGQHPRAFVLDFSDVPFADTSAAKMLGSFVGRLAKSGTRIYFCGANLAVRRALLNAGLREPAIRYVTDADAARAEAHAAQIG
jgi:sulfate permease, SulP family